MAQETEPKKRYNIFEEQEKSALHPGVVGHVKWCPFCHRYIPDFIIGRSLEEIRNYVGGALECIHCGQTLNPYLVQIQRYQVTCPSCGGITWHEDDRSLEVLKEETDILCGCGQVLNPYLVVYKWAHLYHADCCGRGYILYGDEDPKDFRKKDTFRCDRCGSVLNGMAQVRF